MPTQTGALKDQSIPKEGKTYRGLELFKTRSIGGHIIVLHGPLHWSSKRQKITARSLAEAEIYATDECVKDLIYLRNILLDLDLKHTLPEKTTVYNDNMACVTWSKSKTTKGLRYIQIRENAIRENPHITVEKVEGKTNPSDMFSKEDKDPVHYLSIRDQTVKPPLARKCSTLTHDKNHIQQNIAIAPIACTSEQGGYCTNVRSSLHDLDYKY